MAAAVPIVNIPATGSMAVGDDPREAAMKLYQKILREPHDVSAIINKAAETPQISHAFQTLVSEVP